MRLHKALKLRKSLIGEIAKLQQQISQKNSFTVGSLDTDKYNVEKIYETLLKKVQDLVNLKIVINEANREIQGKIFMLSEYKSLINFWNNVSVTEGDVTQGYGNVVVLKYAAQVDEEKRNALVAEFQKKVDAIQEEIDTYNYTTDVQWDEPEPKEA